MSAKRAVAAALATLVATAVLLGTVATASADNCGSPGDCFLNIPFLLGLGVVIGLLLFFAGGWLGVGGWFGIGFLMGWAGGIEFLTPMTNTDPNDPNVAHNQDLIDHGANTTPPGAGSPNLQDLANAANPSGGTNNCGTIAEAMDSNLGGHAASETGVGDANNGTLDANHGSYFHDMPAGQSPGDFASGMLDSPGDRGIIQVQQGGSGHVFNAVNIDGTVYYIDGQSHTVSSDINEVLNATGYTHPDSVSILPTT